MPFTKAIEDGVALNIGNAVKVPQVVLNGGRNTLRHIDGNPLNLAFHSEQSRTTQGAELLHQIAAQVQISETQALIDPAPLQAVEAFPPRVPGTAGLPTVPLVRSFSALAMLVDYKYSR